MRVLWLVAWLAVGGGGVSIIPCEEAHLKCAYRTGCGSALQHYMMRCSALGHRPHVCPEPCQYALIALMSTKEGKQLMTCECKDENCRRTKERVEVCRPEVFKVHNAPVVSCVVAQWICGADALCSTALRYYHANCRSMFQGKRCSPRCKNSINILRRQEKAAKLDTCICDGREDYDCLTIRNNMKRMCFEKPTTTIDPPDTSTKVNEPGRASSLIPSSLIITAALMYLR